jgi:hypothetical protein
MKKVKEIIRRTIGDDRYIALQVRYRFLLERLNRRDLLLVHQMGKVGSTSVVRSLLANPEISRKMALYQTHFLTRNGINFVQQLEERGYGGWSGLPVKTRRLLLTERHLGQHVIPVRLRGKQCRVISLVRDPIATNLSGFFFNYHWWPDGLRHMCETCHPGWQKALLECFLTSYPHSVPLTWFDTEMRITFGLDVYQTPFAKEKGIAVYENERVHLLVLKLEKLHDSGSNAIGEFLGIPDFEILTANQGSQKWYAGIYRNFLEGVALPPKYRHAMLTSQHAEHFFSLEERNQFDAQHAKGQAVH